MSVIKRETVSCPFCKKSYISESSLFSHMETEHHALLNGLSPANVLFNLRNKKSGSVCIICKKPVKFNEQTRKYNRLCERPKCKEDYVKLFKERMVKKFGKEHLLNDPDQQKAMLQNRSISSVYTWRDGKKFSYTASYEKDFLEYLDLQLEWDSEDLISPCPIEIYYLYEGQRHFYIADFYIPSLDLIIEIKGQNNHYQNRDVKKELAKDEAAKKSDHNYYKIVDKNYTLFTDRIHSGFWKVKSNSPASSARKILHERNERIIALSESYAEPFSLSQSTV